jgi:hypothetical protein
MKLIDIYILKVA